MCAGYICMRGMCTKIQYRLETTGVRCNIVDCCDRQTNDRTTGIGADTEISICRY